MRSRTFTSWGFGTTPLPDGIQRPSQAGKRTAYDYIAERLRMGSLTLHGTSRTYVPKDVTIHIGSTEVACFSDVTVEETLFAIDPACGPGSCVLTAVSRLSDGTLRIEGVADVTSMTAQQIADELNAGSPRFGSFPPGWRASAANGGLELLPPGADSKLA